MKMNTKLGFYLFLSFMQIGCLQASGNALQYEIVPFDDSDAGMKEQLCVMIREDQEMAKILDTNEKFMRQSYLSCPDLPYPVQSFVCRSTDGLAKIYGFIQYSCHDQYSEYGEIKTIKEDAVGFINGLAVHKDYRGQGIAQALLHHVEDLCRSNGMWKLMLFTGVDNDKAARAYIRYGFNMYPGYSSVYSDIIMIKLIYEN